MDPIIGVIIFAFLGFWFGLWWLYLGVSWALRVLRIVTFRGRV